jgi:DNA gyrase subunit A
MAKKGDKNRDQATSASPNRTSGIMERSISEEMKEAFIDYAMSVITDRALPDVRDGLKPVHRRILYSMHKSGLTASAKFRKSATVVGDVLGSYHPHGDASVYEAMVKMAQPFSARYPLVLGQGNFGSIDGDSAAAYRYTEAKMSRIAGELLADIEKETVDFRDNYDGTKKEPVVLPAGVPNILLNDTLGIAVGMATNIPPHNLREVVDATVHLADHPEATTEDLLEHIKGPDFPLGGVIYGAKDIQQAYTTGRGGILTRGEAEIVENKAGQFQIVIHSIPHRVNKADLIIKVADLVKDKKIEDIKDIRDESAGDIRVVIDLKSGAHPKKILNQLYKHTQLEDKFHVNLVALVDGVPQTLSLKAVLEEFIAHRKEVVRRRAEFDLRKAEAREHILLGLKKALDHIDEIIALIKKSKDRDDAKANLMKVFKFSDRQADAILALQLQRLAGLERKKIEDELKAVQALIKELKELLADPKKILSKIKSELREIADKYGDDRRTKIMKNQVKDITLQDMIPNEDSILVFTSGGYVKRTDPSEYKQQKRGGMGVVDLKAKEEDFVTTFLTSKLHNDLLFFTDKGKVYQIKMYDLPEGKRATRGKSVMNYLQISADERVTSILPMSESVKNKDLALMMITKNGVVKKVDAASFHDVRRSGIIAINLTPGDELVSASFVKAGERILLVTKKGQSILFNENDVREMGRTAGGVRGMKVGKDDAVIAGIVIWEEDANPQLFVLSQNGYGKKTPLTEYSVQKRGGSGVKTAKVTAKTGDLSDAMILTDAEEEIVVMSEKSQVIRIAIKELPTLSRSTQGVRIMKLRPGDSIASLVYL